MFKITDFDSDSYIMLVTIFQYYSCYYIIMTVYILIGGYIRFVKMALKKSEKGKVWLIVAIVNYMKI